MVSNTCAIIIGSGVLCGGLRKICGGLRSGGSVGGVECRANSDLVHNKVGGPPEHQVPVLQDVDETTRGCNHNLASLSQAKSLVLARNSSNHGNGVDVQRLAELQAFGFDLLRQLARGGENHGVRTLFSLLNSTWAGLRVR